MVVFIQYMSSEFEAADQDPVPLGEPRKISHGDHRVRFGGTGHGQRRSILERQGRDGNEETTWQEKSQPGD